MARQPGTLGHAALWRSCLCKQLLSWLSLREESMYLRLHSVLSSTALCPGAHCLVAPKRCRATCIEVQQLDGCSLHEQTRTAGKLQVSSCTGSGQQTATCCGQHEPLTGYFSSKTSRTDGSAFSRSIAFLVEGLRCGRQQPIEYLLQ